MIFGFLFEKFLMVWIIFFFIVFCKFIFEYVCIDEVIGI